MTAALRSPVQALCRHDEAAWTATDVPGLTVQCQEVADARGGRLIVVRQSIAERPQAGGKTLLAVPGYKFQASRPNLPAAVPPLEVWHRHNGRADIENRNKELGAQFGLKGLCCRSFWATEAASAKGLQLDYLNTRVTRIRRVEFSAWLARRAA